jgi:hypothetical protein
MNLNLNSVSDALSSYLGITQSNQSTASNEPTTEKKVKNTANKFLTKRGESSSNLSNRAFVDLSKTYTGILKDNSTRAPDKLAEAIYAKLSAIEKKKQSLLELIINITTNFFSGYGFQSDKNLASEAKSNFWFNQNFSYSNDTKFYELSDYGKNHLTTEQLNDFLANCDEKTRLIVNKLSFENHKINLNDLEPAYFKKFLPNLKEINLGNNQIFKFEDIK